MACKLREAAADARAAYAACFDDDEAPNTAAALVLMSTLRSGDVVVTLDDTGTPRSDRIVLNQHTHDSARAGLLEIKTAGGATLSVTPDHVISIDGTFAPAERARVGATLRTRTLGAGFIASVRETFGGIINPVTASGTILVASADGGEPLLASTHPAWIAHYFLPAPSFPLVGTRLLSLLAPRATQATYEALEASVAYALPAVQGASAALPAAVPLGVIVADAAFSIAVLARVLALPLALASVATLAVRKV